ncbi:MAG: hypothetical protein KFB96_19030 [Thiocapsa sp.]|uniref:hypothetical protein n=1 Tax=Thiocapsa sp. TaxID=2024551 RepID=UPI001BCBC56A|nr:hypothetical protein [Thiocapsa sp.]QVL47756.1 MAG: hypothetical protein KFB96_19030 [Thiocapsa sp.]
MLIEHLQQTQRLIIESRGQRRTSMRISTYDDIQEQHLPKIIEIFQQLRRNSDLLKAHYLRLIKTSRTGLLVGATLGLFGFVASAASILSWFGVDWSQVNHLDEPKAAIVEQTEQFPAERPQSLHHTEKPRHLIDTPHTITDSIDSPPSE